MDPVTVRAAPQNVIFINDKDAGNASQKSKGRGRSAIVLMHMMSRRFLILIALPLAALAEKRPVTIDDVVATRAPRSGSGPIHWAPDGKRFAFREGNSIWQYDAQSKLKKEIVSLVPLREKAVKSPPAEAFDWQN